MKNSNEINNDSELINCIVGNNVRIFSDCFIKNTKMEDDVVIRDFARIESSVLHNHCDIQRTSMIYSSEIGAYTYTGKNITIWHAKIGKFCSISWNVSIGGANHGYEKITSHAFLYAPQFGLLKGKKALYNRFSEKCIIGNDVWIGCNAVILRNVTIGDGAVIGAGAVVTKDVEPYSIVAGVPAKVIGRRCSPELGNQLSKSHWWDLPKDIISNNIELFSTAICEDSVKKICQLWEQ